MEQAEQPVQYLKYSTSGVDEVDGGVISETAAALYVNGQEWLTFLCTPTHLDALALGFLFNEGIIHSASEVADIRVCEKACNLDVWLRHTVEKPAQWRRTSGCTGGATGEQAPYPSVDINPDERIAPHQLLGCMEQLFQTQQLYREVRGVHCSGLSDGEQIFLAAEDIGRHNTLDKIAGMALLNPPVMDRRIILTTGRISSEMLQKSARLGAQVVVSRTSPSSLSIRLAEELGITLIGYARRNQFNVYTHSERLALPAGWTAASIRECVEC